MHEVVRELMVHVADADITRTAEANRPMSGHKKHVPGDIKCICTLFEHSTVPVAYL